MQLRELRRSRGSVLQSGSILQPFRQLLEQVICIINADSDTKLNRVFGDLLKIEGVLSNDGWLATGQCLHQILPAQW